MSLARMSAAFEADPDVNIVVSGQIIRIVPVMADQYPIRFKDKQDVSRDKLYHSHQMIP